MVQVTKNHKIQPISGKVTFKINHYQLTIPYFCNSSMRIAFLSTFYPFRGGIAQFNAGLYRALEKEHEVRAFTFTTQYPGILFPGQSQYISGSDPADKIPSHPVLSTINPISYFSAANAVSAWNPDLVITKFWMPFFGPSLGTVLRKTKKNSVNISILDNVIPHEKRPGDMMLTRFFLNQNQGFVVMSETVKKDLLSLQPGAKYVFQPHPLYNHFGKTLPRQEAIEKLNLNPNKKWLLFFGFIRDYKGLDILIQAMKKLPEEFGLIIAGEVYGSFDKYETLIEELDLGERIALFTRYIRDEEVPRFFSASEACILPYKSATQSGIISIAFHFQLPVIATREGGLSEYIHEGETGCLIDEPNAQKTAEAILRFSKDGQKEIFRNGIKRAAEGLTWQAMGNKIVELEVKIQKIRKSIHP